MKKQRRQYAQYILRHWKHYERDRELLTTPEIKSARELFLALGKLSESDRQVLFEKYHEGKPSQESYYTGLSESNKPVPDRVLAERRNLSLGEYAHLRIRTEQKFAKELEKVKVNERQRLDDVLDKYLLKQGALFISWAGYKDGRYTIVLNDDERNAKVFGKDNQLADETGYTKVPPSDRYN